MTASAERPASPVLAWLRIAGLAGLFLACLPPHLLSKWLRNRSPWPQRFLRFATVVVGVRPTVEGAPLQLHSLVVANHTSWLDIMLLGGWTGTAFVSKAEVENTPLLGWLANQNRTLYIHRSARHHSHGQVRQIADALAHGQPLAVFPEGTTGSGRHLLTFRSTLLEAVAPAPAGVEVRPVAIDYGEFADLVGWHSGEPGIANFMRVLGHRGALPVTVRLLAPLAPSEDRKELARMARQSIAAALSSLARPTGL